MPEVLLAFSIYMVCVVMFVSLFNMVVLKDRELTYKYKLYVMEQNEKELTLWQ